jgi:hypothetical protein
MAIAADSHNTETPERRPGEFARHPNTGAPYVAHPTKTSKRQGNKADLIAEASRLGIGWAHLNLAAGKTPTVAQLHELLGPRPSMVMYGRPSSLGKQIENMTNIQKWSERAVALGLWLDFVAATQAAASPELLEGLGQLTPEQWNLDDADARELLDKIAVKAKNLAQAGLAADRGTHVHERTEDHDTERDWIEAANRGEDLGLPVEVQAALVAAWQSMLQEYDLEVLAVEAVCVDDVWRQAGTLDRIARLRRDLDFILPTGEKVTIAAGTVLILDIKTGKLRLDRSGFVSYWHGYSVQLASYAQSLPYDPDTDTRGEWEWPIAQDYAIIAHLDVLSALEGEAVCRLVLVDLAAGREAGERCVWAREWEKRTDVFSLPIDELAVRVPVDAQIAEPAAAQPATESDAASPSDSVAPVANTVEATPHAPVTAVEPVSPDGGGTGSATPEDRRAKLLARYQGLCDDDKLKYLAMGVDSADLDAIAAALDLVDPFAQTATPAPRVTPAPEPAPAERDAFADTAVINQFVATIAGSGASRRAACNAWLKQGLDGGSPWNPRVHPTVANLERTRAAFALSVWVDDGLDEPESVVRAVLAAALDTDAAQHPTVAVGVAIGHLSATEARSIVTTCERIDRAELILTFSTDGPPRFIDRDAAAHAAA